MSDGGGLLLLPGMMCDRRLWQAQLETFGADYDCRVGDITGAESIAEIAAQVLAAAPGSWSVAGLSMGGIVALEMWRQAPERITRLALLDTNDRADTPEKRDMRDAQMQSVLAGGLAEVLREELKPNYLACVHRDNTALLDEVLAMGIDLGQEVFMRQSLALKSRPDSRETLPTIACPTLVLCGDEDTLCPPALHREMAEAIPNAQLCAIADCGHLSTMEQPEAVNAALAGWLTRTSNRQDNNNA